MDGSEGLALPIHPDRVCNLTKLSQSVIEAIFFGAASLLNADDRVQYLQTACGSDPVLLAVVKEMLAKLNDAEQFFAEGHSRSKPERPDGASSLPDFDERLGERVGHYRLLQKIGEGGCGAVYLAEQEQPVKRRVALKIIKLGMDTRNVIARFEMERQTLALMDHPNIARVLDAGATLRGRPFFVMEQVDGTKITDFCDANKLNLQKRLALFVQVCHAVQHAHQKGVIHRDLKPSNILVTWADGVPTPKVIDFGIARAIGGGPAHHGAPAVREPFLGTPAYMSPEQAKSDMNVDTTSDVYSLGVLLYELVSGEMPFDSKDLAPGISRRTLAETEPVRPSVKLAALPQTKLQSLAEQRGMKPKKLIACLAEDLDWIILRALAKDRNHRYPSASGLAADVDRFLSNEPLVARPSDQFYRFKKLVRRNKIIFTAGSLAASALVAALAIYVVMYSKVEKAWADERALRLQIEERENLTKTVLLIRQGNYKAAAKLLHEVAPPTHPTLDGMSALRDVGTWQARQGQWQAASDSYLDLTKIDSTENSDTITWDYVSCGVLLAKSGNVPGYEQFRQKVIAKFMESTNVNHISRILNSCLLPPVTTTTLAQLQPLETTLDRWNQSANEFQQSALVPLCLWKYRQGDYDGTLLYCGRRKAGEDIESAYDVALHIVAAMAYKQRGQGDEASHELAQARLTIEKHYKYRVCHGNHVMGYWQDWVAARMLLDEGTSVITNVTPDKGKQTSFTAQLN